MTNLPVDTQIRVALSKKSLYALGKLSTAERHLLDSQLSRLTLIHELSPHSLKLPRPEDFEPIFVLKLTLKQGDCPAKLFTLLSKLIPRRLVFLVDYQGKRRLAIVHKYVFMSPWDDLSAFDHLASVLDFPSIWSNLVAKIAGFKLHSGHNTDEAVALFHAQSQLLSRLKALEAKALKEVQPRKKYELVQQINKLQKELKEYDSSHPSAHAKPRLNSSQP